MQTISDALDALGRDEVQDALGLTPSSLSDAIRDGKFPARWYGPMKEMADRKRIPLPLNLFHWRRVPDEPATAKAV